MTIDEGPASGEIEGGVCQKNASGKGCASV